MTPICFQTDADLKQSIVSGVWRRQPGVDFQSANAANFEGKTDQEVLAIAAKDGRVLVTHDRKTMPLEFAEFITTQTSAGVLILSQTASANEAIEWLLLVWEASIPEEWLNRLVTLPF